jgi:hypothetical protein
MSTIPNAFFTSLEIVFYSGLTSIISGVHRIQAHFGHLENDPSQSTLSNAAVSPLLNDQFPAKPSVKGFNFISQMLLSVLIWTILGFSTGFLIGMLNTK